MNYYMAEIIDSIESERGCGYRKKGGIYLMGGRFSHACGKLPIPLTVCPCCNQGIKQTRGFSWISYALIKDAPCSQDNEGVCLGCDPFNASYENEKIGLIWVGEKFYGMPGDFSREANKQGISRRLSQVPKDLVIGETWVLLAHRKACSHQEYTEEGGEPVTIYTPGIFAAFKPDRIEYVVKGTETPEEIERLEKRGFILVNVIPDKDAQLSTQSET